MKKAMTSEQLFGAGSGHFDEIDIPELGGVLYLREPSADEVLDLADLEDADDAKGKNAHQNKLIAKLLVDENGERIVSEDDAQKLTGLPWKVYKRLVDAVTGDINEDGEVAADRPN